MKKITAILSAAVLLAGACSCSDKPDVSEPDGDVTTAPVTDTEPPIEVNSADLSSIDFGARMSPCKAPDVRESYKNSMMRHGNEERFDEAVAKLVETPCKGAVTSATFGGGKFYLTVNYDDFCNLHDSSLYCYDVETGECKELAAHTGLEYNGCFSWLTFAHDKLYYIDKLLTDSDEGTKTALYCLDPESGDISELCTVDGYIHDLHEIENGLSMYRYIGGNNGSDYLQYDIGTNELSPYTFPEAEGEGPKDVVLCDGVPAEVTGGFDGEKYNPITVKTQYYTISTDINYANSIFTWRDKLCIISIEGVSGSWMYTYDITNRERLKMKFEGYGGANIQQTNDGLLAFVPSNNYGGSADSNATRQHVIKLYYIIPTLAVEYRFGECDDYLQTDLSTAADKPAYILTLKSLGNEFRASGIYVGYDPTNRNVPDKLYWFDTE